jgi:methyl-accepting chemotaxis protein
MRFSKLSLSNQVATVSIVTSLLIIGLLSQIVAHISKRDLLAIEVSQLQTQLGTARSMVELSYDVAKSTTNTFGNVLSARFSEAMSLQADRKIIIDGIATPALIYRGRTLNQDFTDVDAFKQETHGIATIFVRSGENFIRISTNLMLPDGRRAVGTQLDPAHPAYAQLLKGDSYLGAATLFERLYITTYMPIKDGGGKVIGALFVGSDASGWFSEVMQSISSVHVGSTGYLFVIKTNGSEKGKLLIHPTLQGKNLAEVEDANGGHPFQPVIEDDSGTFSYPWKQPNGDIVDKQLSFVHSPAWGGIAVAATVPREELVRESRVLGNTILMTGAVAAILMAAILLCYLRHALSPMARLADIVTQAGEGDLTIDNVIVATPADSRNELHLISQQIARMVRNVRSMVADISERVGSMATTSQQMEHTAKEMASAATSQSAAASAMAAGVEQMAVSVNMISDNAQHVDHVTDKTRALSGNGRTALDRAKLALAQIDDNVNSSAKQVDQLGENSARISAVVSLIEGIADQTNLLALNAAIEASRAGEQGRGFSVVADEVRKLAERTTHSTTEISQIIDALLGGIDVVTNSMMRTKQLMLSGAQEIAAADTAIDSIFAGADDAANASRDISHGLREQAAASNSLGFEVEKVGTLSEETSRDETFASAKQISVIAGQITNSVARFRVA